MRRRNYSCRMLQTDSQLHYQMRKVPRLETDFPMSQRIVGWMLYNSQELVWQEAYRVKNLGENCDCQVQTSHEQEALMVWWKG
jgi:hypothetical protein